MNNPLNLHMRAGLYQASWQDDGIVLVEKLLRLRSTGKVLGKKYVRHGAVVVLREEASEETAYVLFVVEQAPNAVHLSKESVIADLIDALTFEGDVEARRTETLNDLNKAFLNIVNE